MTEPSPPRVLACQGVTWARVRLAERLGRAAIAVFVGGLLVGVARPLFEQLPLAYTMFALVNAFLTIASVGLLITSFIVWFRRAASPGAVTIDASGIELRRGGTTRRIERSKIASAYALTRYVRGAFASTIEVELEGGDLVSFEVNGPILTAHGDMTHRVPSDEVARAIVDDLGFGRGKKRIHIALGSPARRLYHLLMGLVAYYAGSIAAAPLFFLFLSSSGGFSSALTGVVSALVMVLSYRFFRGLMRAPEVTIGDDGVLVRSGRKRRFLAGATITGVDHPSVALPLLLRSSREAPIAIHGSALDFERRTAVAQLAYERFLAPVGPGDQGSAQFARGGRTLVAWREHLRTRVGDIGYREAASPTDIAAAALLSPRSTGEERVGAALALRLAGEPPERIRVAASAAADDHLRLALESIGEVDEDVALERALRKLT